jgi:hypothetical protein
VATGGSKGTGIDPLAPWASRRRQDLLDLLDQLTPKIQELTRELEEEVEKRPVTRLLMTHPGVGPLTALTYELVIGTPERFHCGKQLAGLLAFAIYADVFGLIFSAHYDLLVTTYKVLARFVSLGSYSDSPGYGVEARCVGMRQLAPFVLRVSGWSVP